jgi:hypothetical protein
VVYSHGTRDFHVIGIGEKGWGRFEIRLKSGHKAEGRLAGARFGFRRRSPLAMFFWICRMLKSVDAASASISFSMRGHAFHPDILTAM